MNNTITLFADDSRGQTQIITLLLLTGLAISGIAIASLEAGDLQNQVERTPEATVLIDPGREAVTVVVKDIQNADELNVTVNGNEVYNNTNPAKTVNRSTGETLTLNHTGGTPNTVNISNVSSTAWDDSNGRVASNTTITVNAVAGTSERVINEYTQP